METPQKHRSVTRFSGETKQKHHAATTGSNGEETTKHEHTTGSGGGPSGETMPKKSCRKKKTVPKKRRFPEEIMKLLQEADRVIQELNERGLGEDISSEELEFYDGLLPDDPPWVDTSIELDHEQLHKRYVSQVLYRVKYYNFTSRRSKGGAAARAVSRGATTLMSRKMTTLSRSYGASMKMEWTGNKFWNTYRRSVYLGTLRVTAHLIGSFSTLSLLAWMTTSACIVLHNFCGYGFANWDRYRKYFHNTLISAKSCRRNLSGWKRACLSFGTLLRGGKYSTEDLPKQSRSPLAFPRYLRIAYLRVWKLVAKLKMSFRAALDEVYKLDKFPLRQHRMRVQLESDGSEMENEFDICTAGITEDVAEDKVQELIADAITKLEGRLKFYAQYVRRKIEIARAIGVIPAASP
ncbi:hypothetical protein EJB05_43764, partial [Eragrostis curvula]